ncbi:hypothetical protein HB779_21080 (plasmid) [Phyllobacterium sp. 628]|uniref:hypothetical protein n=1 Tax=Phyllobacterium sp. 628 TaxID=2718938 RepID=UPI0016624539|nr:hypothetical protein [Phyllobacterium sp. 628]QND54417.1 hypothetical protein HB779_21080 [Phyllobacterium sp. 628]
MTVSVPGAQDFAFAWSTYLNNTARFVHPSRLSECFGGMLLPEGIEYLRNSRRVGRNVRRLIGEHFALPALPDDLTLEAPDLQLLLMSAEDVTAFELRCGAMFLANSLAQIIQSAAVHKLRETLGQEVYGLALAHRHLAISAEPITDPEALLAAMRKEGQACLSSWRASMPDTVNQWYGLKHPTNAQIQPAHSGDRGKRALSIVRHSSTSAADMAAA